VWLRRHSSVIKPMLLFFGIVCVLIELVATRHVYYFLAYVTFDADNGWYRARLIDIALAHLGEYWATGYGLYTDPGWGMEINGIPITDTVNHYIFLAVVYGAFGAGAFISLLLGATICMWRVGRRARTHSERTRGWALLSSLVGLGAAFWTVCVFGAMTSVLYLVFGMCGSVWGHCLERRPMVRQRCPKAKLRASD